MKLKSLSLKNFKSYREGKIVFSDKFTAITGISNHGKTNFLRGFVLLSDNTPLGGDYLFDQLEEGEVEVCGEFDNGVVIRLSKYIRKNKKGELTVKPGSAKYYIGKESFSGGSKVPDKVSELLNIGKLNIQRQFDIPFLITSSAPEIARVLNRIAKLEEGDKWVKTLESMQRTCNSEISVYEKQIKEHQTTIESLEGVDEIGPLFDSLAVVEKEFLKTSNEVLSLQKIITDIDRCIGIQNRLGEDVANCSELFTELDFVDAELSDCVFVFQEVDRFLTASNFVKHTDTSEVENLFVDLDAVEEELDQINNVANSIMNMEHYKNEEEKFHKRMLLAKAEFEEAVEKENEDPRCPYCNSQIEQKLLDEIMFYMEK